MSPLACVTRPVHYLQLDFAFSAEATYTVPVYVQTVRLAAFLDEEMHSYERDGDSMLFNSTVLVDDSAGNGA